MQTIFAFPTTPELGITGEQERLAYECLRDGCQHTLASIGEYMFHAGKMAISTSISARIRDLNKRLRPNGFEIKWKYVRSDSSLTVYWLTELRIRSLPDTCTSGKSPSRSREPGSLPPHRRSGMRGCSQQW